MYREVRASGGVTFRRVDRLWRHERGPGGMEPLGAWCAGQITEAVPIESATVQRFEASAWMLARHGREPGKGVPRNAYPCTVWPGALWRGARGRFRGPGG